jgi:hypothetical protein
VPVLLQPDVFEVKRPADAEVAQAFVAAVVGAGLASLSEERREAKHKHENRSRHARRIDRDRDR